MKLKILIFAAWGVLFSGAVLADSPPPAQVSDVSSNASSPQERSKLLLIGIAKIDESHFVYLLDRESGEAIEAGTKRIHSSGLELVEVKETAQSMEARVRLRKDGVEWWLSFAGASAVAAASPSPKPVRPVQPPLVVIKRAPARNPGTFSNDSPSFRRPARTGETQTPQ